MSTSQPVNAAMPEEAVTGFASQVRVAPFGVVNASATTVELSHITGSPLASRRTTTGWASRVLSLVPLLGWVVKSRALADTTVAESLGSLDAVQVASTAVTAYV